MKIWRERRMVAIISTDIQVLAPVAFGERGQVDTEDEARS
jgi:hypothetical protein